MIWELLLLFLIMVVQVVVPPIPAELIVIGAGKQYGVVVTAIVAGSGLTAGSMLVYWLGGWIEQRFGRIFARQQVQTVMARLRKVETPLLLIRALPYNPSDVISYAAGIIKIKKKKFILLTCLTSYSRCFVLGHFGAAVSSLGSLLAIGSLLLVSALIAAGVVYGRQRREG